MGVLRAHRGVYSRSSWGCVGSEGICRIPWGYVGAYGDVLCPWECACGSVEGLMRSGDGGEEGMEGVSSRHDPRSYMVYKHLQYLFMEEQRCK